MNKPKPKFTPGTRVNVFKYRPAIRTVRKQDIFDDKEFRDVQEKYQERYFNNTATFEAWGVDYEEFEAGPGSYSCAIVSTDDGKVELIPAEMIETTLKAATNEGDE